MFDLVKYGVNGKTVPCLSLAAILTTFRTTNFVVFCPKIAYEL